MSLTPMERAERNGERPAGARPTGQRNSDGGGWIYNEPTAGLTKREHLAATALQGLLANSEALNWAAEQSVKEDMTSDAILCRLAVRHADALLLALERSRE